MNPIPANAGAATIPVRGPIPLAPGVLLRIGLAAVAAVYAPTVTFDFVYDDFPQIVMNPWLLGWDWAPDYFTKHSWWSTRGWQPCCSPTPWWRGFT